jgi:hypothetical protein
MDSSHYWLRDPRLLLISGVLLGIGLGLLIGWQLWPVSYYNTELYDLHTGYQDDFVVMVGALYALEGDAQAARQALAQLSPPSANRSPESMLIEVTERYIAQGASPTDIHYLVNLADALDSRTTPMQPYLDSQQP